MAYLSCQYEQSFAPRTHCSGPIVSFGAPEEGSRPGPQYRPFVTPWLDTLHE